MSTITIEVTILKEECGISEFESLMTALNFSSYEMIGYIEETEEPQMRKGLIAEFRVLENLKNRIWDTFFKNMTQKQLSDTPQKP